MYLEENATEKEDEEKKTSNVSKSSMNSIAASFALYIYENLYALTSCLTSKEESLHKKITRN